MIAEQIMFSGVALSIGLIAIGILLANLNDQVRRIADTLRCAKEMHDDE